MVQFFFLPHFRFSHLKCSNNGLQAYWFGRVGNAQFNVGSAWKTRTKDLAHLTPIQPHTLHCFKRLLSCFSISHLLKYCLATGPFNLVFHFTPPNVFCVVLLSSSPAKFVSDAIVLLPLTQISYGRHTAYFSSSSIWNNYHFTLTTVHDLVPLK